MPKNNFTFILVGLVIITFAGTIWYFSRPENKTDSITPKPSSSTLPARVPPAGWKEYRNTTYAISFFYPEGLSMKEFKETGSAMTVTFEDVADGKEFQMFIVPYANAEITTERIKLDIPSGVKEGEENIVVDGVRGTKFFSQDKLLGNTREIWFIHNGFLYEVTTHKELDAWMTDILATWRFISVNITH
jgi:hypothetical protein